MPRLTLSLCRTTLEPGHAASFPKVSLAVAFAHDGDLRVGDVLLAEGTGIIAPDDAQILNSGTTPVTALIYSLSKSVAESALVSEDIDVSFPCLLRLDEVAFPPGAVARRHVHAGAGFRHLRSGALTLDTDDHSFDVAPGGTWFEAAQSPVRATAIAPDGETRFLRCMVVPPEFKGRTTIRILDPAEAALPRRQVTHMHVDHLMESWPYVDAG